MPPHVARPMYRYTVDLPNGTQWTRDSRHASLARAAVVYAAIAIGTDGKYVVALASHLVGLEDARNRLFYGAGLNVERRATPATARREPVADGGNAAPERVVRRKGAAHLSAVRTAALKRQNRAPEWSDARTCKLRDMCAAGYSSQQIADALGVSRSAVCGKVYRWRTRASTDGAPIALRSRAHMAGTKAPTRRYVRAPAGAVPVAPAKRGWSSGTPAGRAAAIARREAEHAEKRRVFIEAYVAQQAAAAQASHAP